MVVALSRCGTCHRVEGGGQAELQKGTRVLVGVRNHCGTILSPITEVNLTEAKIHRDHGDGTFSIRTISSGTEWAPFDPSDLRIMPEWL
mmetsp:Transcript_199/g.291  ORF Transcript_199/g.291 Transcript_199/m.291 type:complete len:89 (-) Transcript_199:77-343(-)